MIDTTAALTQSADATTLLRGLGERLAACADPEQQIALALQTAAELSGCGLAQLALRENGGDKRHYLYGYPTLAPTPTANTAAIPLRWQDDLLGELELGEPSRALGAGELAALDLLGYMLAATLANAHLRERLQAARRQLQTLHELSPDAQIVVDTAAAVIGANAAADRLFGVAISASQGRDLVALLAQSPYTLKLRGANKEPVLPAEALVPGQSFSGELELGQPEPTTLAVNFLPIMGQHERIVGALVQFHDISEWKRMGQLRTDFIGAVSHELRTPLTSIKGLVRLALDEDLGPLSVWQRDSLAVADAEIDRLTGLINDLLDISRIEAGRMRISFEQIDPAALLAALVDRAQAQAQERGVVLRASLPPGLPPIRADRQRIEQVVGNLLGNGIKFTGAGGTLVVSAAAEEPLLVVRVSDSGIGIPEQYLDHIFERFFQVAPGPATSGTGLGLAIAKQLVELHGGQIFVASTLGQGTTVTFTLPLWT